MSLWKKLAFWKEDRDLPIHLQHGTLGENAAKIFLQRKGLGFLTARFRGKRGEIDLIFRDENCLVFVEVKTRSPGSWTRPSRAVDSRKRLALSRTAADYLRLIGNPQVAYRFDVVEVLLDASGAVKELRHIENGFNSTALRRSPARRFR
jgi:putative endonuclease